MRLPRLLGLLLFTVATTDGLNSCFSDDACASGAASMDFRRCEITDEDVVDLAACFDNAGRSTIGEVELGSNQLTTLPLDLFDGFESLLNLTLSDNSLVLMDANFKGATSLEILHLHENWMDNLPSAVFEGLTSLQQLNLRTNSMSELPGGIFDALPSLSWFNPVLRCGVELLRDFKTTELSSRPAEPMYHTTQRKVSFNDLSTLEEGIFDGTPNLEHLDLEYNDFSTPPANTFQNVTSLKYLALQVNPLSTLPDGTFSRLTSLEQLRLYNTQLISIEADVFDGLDKLWELFLSYNELVSLPAEIFRGTPALEYLYLQNNQFTELPSDIFAGLENLRELDLNANEISSLPAGIFDGTPLLADLEMASNGLSAVPANLFDGTPVLQYLRLSRNAIPSLPAGLFDHTLVLESLQFDDNVITTLPDGLFKGLSLLETLSLYDNQLATVATDAFDDLQSMDFLSLDDNLFSTLPAGLFDGLEVVRHVGLEGNADLQCAPATDALSLSVPEGVDKASICECPEEATCDEEGNACDCQPGNDGYSCVGSSSDIVIRAFSCQSSAPSAPATTTPAPTTPNTATPATAFPTGGIPATAAPASTTPGPTATGLDTPAPFTEPLVDAGVRTTVIVAASAYDERMEGYGCSPDGCTSDKTRDNNLEANSRWSCKGDLIEEVDGLCCIEYNFEEPLELIRLDIAFYKGTERTRTLNMYNNGEFISQVESSGSSDDYEAFPLDATGGTTDFTICLHDPNFIGDEWLSITENASVR